MTITLTAKFVQTTLSEVAAYTESHTDAEALAWFYDLPYPLGPSSQTNEVIVAIFALIDDPETYTPSQMVVNITTSYHSSLRFAGTPTIGGEEITESHIIESFHVDSLGRTIVGLFVEHLYNVVGPITTLSQYNYDIEIVNSLNTEEHYANAYNGILSFPFAPEPEPNGYTFIYGTNPGAAPLTWDKPGSLTFDTGLDKGVLYLSDRSGIAWNGLTAIQEQHSGGMNEPQYFEGNKYVEIESSGDYSATLTAVTYPDEFLEYDGYIEIAAGVLAANQESKEFHLSYRTLVGDELVGINAGYKIHIVYNLTAVPSEISYQTTGDSIDLSEFSWDLSTRPETAVGYQPTAHIIVDSRYVNPDVLNLLEDIIYGTNSVSAYLPPLNELLNILIGYNRLVITDNGDGTYTATGPDSYFSSITDDSFTLISDTAFNIKKLFIGGMIAEPITVLTSNPVLSSLPIGTQIFFPYATPPGIWETNGSETLSPITEYSGTTLITENLAIYTQSQYPTIAIAVDALIASQDPDFVMPAEYGPTASVMMAGKTWFDWLAEQITHGMSGVLLSVFMSVEYGITENIADNFVVSSTPLD